MKAEHDRQILRKITASLEGSVLEFFIKILFISWVESKDILTSVSFVTLQSSWGLGMGEIQPKRGRTEYGLHVFTVLHHQESSQHFTHGESHSFA